MPFDPKFRDRLCELETPDPHLRERYEKELQSMLEKKLSLPRKAFVGLVGLAAIVIAIYLGWLAWGHAELPTFARAALVGGVIFALAWASLTVFTVRRGTWDMKTHPGSIAALSWIFAVLLETCFLVFAPQFPDHFHAGLALVLGLLLVIGAGVSLVCARIQQAELRTRESLLYLEYHLAALSEARGKAQ